MIIIIPVHTTKGDDVTNQEIEYKTEFGIDEQAFFAINSKQRLPYLDKHFGNKEPFHILYSQQFNKDIINRLIDLAEAIRKLQKTRTGAKFLQSLLPHKSMLGFFGQKSSRTAHSFRRSGKMLGMDVEIEHEENASTQKGETLEDTIRTYASYYHGIFIRHYDPLAVEKAAWVVNQMEPGERIPIFNAGSGANQHVTQMLLDIYTLVKSFSRHGELEGKSIAFVGDLKRSRTARSLIYALRWFGISHIYFVSPPELRMKDDILSFCKKHNMPYTICNNLEDIIEIVDAVYMIRLQDEYEEAVFTKEDYMEAYTLGNEEKTLKILLYLKNFELQHSKSGLKNLKPTPKEFKFLWDYRHRFKKSGCVLHALPKRDEIDTRYDFCPDPYYQWVWWKQAKNGLFMRSGLEAYVYGVEEEILEEYKKQYK